MASFGVASRFEATMPRDEETPALDHSLFRHQPEPRPLELRNGILFTAIGVKEIKQFILFLILTVEPFLTVSEMALSDRYRPLNCVCINQSN